MVTIAKHGLDSSEVAGLVRDAADGDRRAWERLVDQYARLIWSITAEFKLIGKRRRRRRPDDLAAIARAHRPHRVPGSCRLLAGGDRTKRVPAQPGGAQEGGPQPGRSRTPQCRGATGPRSMSACSPTSAIRSCATPCPGLPRRWQRLLEMLMADPPVVLRRHIRRARASRSAASAPPGAGAWPGYASSCRRHEPSVAASTHRPPAPSTSGKVARTSASRSGTKSSTASGRLAASWAGSATGMSVPGIRSPCLAGEASITAGRRSRSTCAWHNSATARDAAP